MATLFETLQKRLADPQQAAPVPQQSEVERLLKAKRGKAATGAAPVASNLGEQSAIGQVQAGQQAQRLQGVMAAGQLGQAADAQKMQTNLAGQQLQQQGALAQQSLAAKGAQTRQQLAGAEDLARTQTQGRGEMAIQEMNHRATMALNQLAAERNITLDNLFTDFDASNQELEFRKDAAALEQRAFLLAMQDKDYLAELDRVGRQQMLQNDLNFQQEMSQVVLGDNLDRYLEELDFKKFMRATEREYEQFLQSMGGNIAIDIARQAIRDEGTRQMWTGIGNTVGAVASDMTSDRSVIRGAFSSENQPSTNQTVSDEPADEDLYGG